MSFLTVSRMSSGIASLNDIANKNAPTGMVTATFGSSWVKAVRHQSSLNGFDRERGQPRHHAGREEKEKDEECMLL